MSEEILANDELIDVPSYLFVTGTVDDGVSPAAVEIPCDVCSEGGSCESCQGVVCQTCQNCQGVACQTVQCSVAEGCCEVTSEGCEICTEGGNCEYCQDVACQTTQCDICQDSCQTLCMAGCEATCQVSCQNCEGNTCLSACQNCEGNTCLSVCQNCEGVPCQTCQTVCMYACQTTCQSVCQDTCELGCQSTCELNNENSPFYWTWSGAADGVPISGDYKIQGSEIYVTADEWAELVAYINNKTELGLVSAVTSGDYISEAVANEVAEAVGAPTVNRGDPVTAGFFNDLAIYASAIEPLSSE